jgi:hypothetical protein
MNATLATNNTLSDTRLVVSDQAVVATYRNHADAETAVRRLAADNLPVEKISIIGRNFETHEAIQGFYRPADAALDGASQGAWFGGLFGLMMGAMGFFVLPVVGALMVLGPLSGLIAGAIGGAGVGALINGLVAVGIPREQALKYQERLSVGEFLVVLHGTARETARAHEILAGTTQTYLHMHGLLTEGSTDNFLPGLKM